MDGGRRDRARRILWCIGLSVALVGALCAGLAAGLAGTASADVEVAVTEAPTTTLPPPPTITDISPEYGPWGGGNTVTITGSNFVNVSAVTFGGQPATGITPVGTDCTQIQVTVPAWVSGDSWVAVFVTAAGGTNSDGDFNRYGYVNAPDIEIGSIYPDSGPTSGGNQVEIGGRDFYPECSVTFDGVPATIVHVYPNYQDMIVIAPPHPAPGTVTIQVTAAGGTSEEQNNYTYVQTVGTRFQETDGRMFFSPWWRTSSYFLYSARGEKYSTRPGAAVYIPFRGTRLDWIVKTNSNLGIAMVSIDGGTPVPVDLYSPQVAYQVDVWSTGYLPDGLHWVKIAAPGTRDANSTGWAIDLDAVDVVGTLAGPTRYEDSNPAVMYAGLWVTNASSRFSGGTMKKCSSPLVASPIVNVAGGVSTAESLTPVVIPHVASLMVQFTGIRFSLVATKARGFGKVWVSVDGGPATLVDLYSRVTRYRQTVYSSAFLVPGHHLVVISWSGLKNRYSRGRAVDVDAFDIIGQIEGGVS